MLGSKVIVIQEDGSERKLLPGCSEKGCGWNGIEISTCGDELGRIAVVGTRFGGQKILDTYSQQDGKCSVTLRSVYTNSLVCTSTVCIVTYKLS